MHRRDRTITRLSTTVWLAGLALAVPACRDDDPVGPSTSVVTPALQASTLSALSFLRVNAGAGRTCGVATDNQAYCWGSNSQGVLGDGTTDRSLKPVAVAGGIQFRQVSEGANHTCGVATDNRAYCWGDNQFGELGDGTTSVESHTPVPVAGGLLFQQVSAGGLHTCGVTTSSLAYCWGKNDGHQLGITGGSGTEQRTPALVAGGRQYQHIAAGSEHQCAITTAGRAFCWGWNGSGQVGDGSSGNLRTAPVRVAGELVLKAVSAEGDYTCALTTTNRAWCWGQNLGGQLGDGTQQERTRPVAVVGGKQFRQLSAGWAHTCAVTPADKAFCWGDNTGGDLGNGNTFRRLTPTAVGGEHLFRQVEAGNNHSCGVTTDDLAYCWGYNNFTGQLGDGTLKNRLRPVAVVGP